MHERAFCILNVFKVFKCMQHMTKLVIFNGIVLHIDGINKYISHFCKLLQGPHLENHLFSVIWFETFSFALGVDVEVARQLMSVWVKLT